MSRAGDGHLGMFGQGLDNQRSDRADSGLLAVMLGALWHQPGPASGAGKPCGLPGPIHGGRADIGGSAFAWQSADKLFRTSPNHPSCQLTEPTSSAPAWSQYDVCGLCRAMDRLGQGVVGLDREQHIVCMIGRARQWLLDYFPANELEGGRELPVMLRSWLEESRHNNGAGLTHPELVLRRGDRRLRVSRVDESGAEPRVWLLLCQDETERALALKALSLTARESEILRWMAEAKSNPEIGIILGTSRHTVRKHVEHILAKLRVESRAAAVMRWRELLDDRS